MKTDVIPYEDHQPTTMSISIDTIHTKSFYIKLTVAKGSIYFFVSVMRSIIIIMSNLPDISQLLIS